MCYATFKVKYALAEFVARDIQMCILRKAANNASQTKKYTQVCSEFLLRGAQFYLLQRYSRITLKRYNLYFIVNVYLFTIYNFMFC